MINEVSIIIPAFNEESGIRQVIAELQTLAEEYDIAAEIIVVDDGSADATARVALATGVRVIQHRNNRGYGASLKSGIEAASYSIIAIIDADGTYPARYLPEMLQKIEFADMVVGARIRSERAYSSCSPSGQMAAQASRQLCR
ncbi:MAG: glycosyltransferase family 2 protein [Pyrinomonadaceae bacterium]